MTKWGKAIFWWKISGKNTENTERKFEENKFLKNWENFDEFFMVKLCVNFSLTARLSARFFVDNEIIPYLLFGLFRPNVDIFLSLQLSAYFLFTATASRPSKSPPSRPIRQSNERVPSMWIHSTSDMMLPIRPRIYHSTTMSRFAFIWN